MMRRGGRSDVPKGDNVADCPPVKRNLIEQSSVSETIMRHAPS
jgi:hypothetical protein